MNCVNDKIIRIRIDCYSGIGCAFWAGLAYYRLLDEVRRYAKKGAS